MLPDGPATQAQPSQTFTEHFLATNHPTNPTPPTEVQRVEGKSDFPADPTRASAATTDAGPCDTLRQVEWARLQRECTNQDIQWPEHAPDWALSCIEREFRHGHWSARRERIFAALDAAQVPVRRLANFGNCGARCYIAQDRRSGRCKAIASYCHDRFCQPCQQSRANRITLALRARVPRARCLHLVLTQKSSDRPLGDQLTTLFQNFAKLRARKFWKNRVTGGCATFETTYNEETQQWHPHLHILAHAEWLDQHELHKQWLAVTGDSSIVHVSLVEHSERAVREVTKYLGSPVHRSIALQPDRLVELITALKGRHLILTFGSWRCDPLLQDSAEDVEADWRIIGSLHRITAQAAAGDVWSRNVLRHLASQVKGRNPVAPPPCQPGP